MTSRRRLSLAFVCLGGLLALGESCLPRTPAKPAAATGATSATAAPASASSGPTSSSGRPQVAFYYLSGPNDKAGAIGVQLATAHTSNGKVVPSELSANETQALLARLEPLPNISADNASAPSLRAPSVAPQPPGRVRAIAFAAPSGKPVAVAPTAVAKASNVKNVKEETAVPLTAPEIMPQGPVTHESEIRLRFQEPMVPVAKVGIAENVPVIVKPKIAGTWRWIDSRVLTFTAANSRFPGATDFVVTVPAGTRGLSGATLTNDQTATFSTRSVEISGRFPSGVLLPNSPIFLEFNQAIDERALLPFLVVTTEKGQRLPFRITTLAAAEELWKKNPSIEGRATRGTPSLVLAPASQWPSDTVIYTVLSEGAPSKEGPRVTSRANSASFSIAAPFELRGISCEGTDNPRRNGAVCPADRSLDVNFSNWIAPLSFHAPMVQIESDIFQDVSPRGGSISLLAPSEQGKVRHIKVSEGLVDVYGQPLVGDRSASFVTGTPRYDPYLEAETGLHVLDPRFEIPQWVVNTEAVSSVRIQLFRVEPGDYFAFLDYEAGSRGIPPGNCVVDKYYPIGPHTGATLRVDLRPALQSAGVGHVIAVATAVPFASRPMPDANSRFTTWIQVTKLGLTARLDGEKVSGWVQNITPAKFLEPVAGANASLLIKGRPRLGLSAISNNAGHVMFELAPPTKSHDSTALLLAEAGADSTFTAIQSFEKAIREESALWYVTDDRFTYKPGEDVYVKGWVRYTHNGVNPGLTLPAQGESVSYILKDSHGVKIAEGKASLSDQGGFDFAAKVPQNANLGQASIDFSMKHGRHSHPISIEEFRRPAFSVTLNDDVSHSGAVPLVLGESIEMSVSAKYYSGGGLMGSPVDWEATLNAASYQPPGWDLFHFGPLQEWSRPDYEHSQLSVNREGALSSDSSTQAEFSIAAIPLNRPSLLSVDATVTDVDRNHIRAQSRSILVHPSTYYVGIRQQPGETDVLEFIVTDIDGNAVPDVSFKVTIEGVLGSERFRTDPKIIDSENCVLKSGIAPVVHRLVRADNHTAYFATATVLDPRHRRNITRYAVPWFPGPESDNNLSIVPDKAIYRVGETAKLEVRSSVLPATAIVTFARQGIIEQKRLELTQASTLVELPILPSFVNNVFVVVDRLAKRQQVSGNSNIPLPEDISAEIELPVDVSSARLEMTTKPTRSLVGPGEKATFDVEVRHEGKPQRDAEVALIVVDEAVLALSAKSHADPLTPFYDEVAAATTHESTIDIVRDSTLDLEGRPGVERYDLRDMMRGRHGEGFGMGGLSTVGHGAGTAGGVPMKSFVSSRKDFRATAAFSPLLKTDVSGRAQLTVTMPDSLTRFRVVALATAQGRLFGKAESAIVTQRKLNARAVAPRFLTQGDRFSLPIIVQNLTLQPRTVDVAVRAANLMSKSAGGQRVTIPAGQRTEVRFDFATKARGRSVIQTIVSSGDFADASNIDVPVYEPATTESFATYGVVDDQPEFEQLAVPKNLYQDVGGVEVQLASTQLQSLTDAYWYLYSYPYECAEQRSSRMLATTAIYDILDAFATEGRPTRKQIDTMRQNDVRVLSKDQREDGGWGYFGRMKSDPYVSMQVLQALAAEHASGTTVKKAIAYVDKRAKNLISELEKRTVKGAPKQWDSGEQAYTISLAAWALTALGSANVSVEDRAEHLHALAVSLDAYPVDAKARLLSIVSKQKRFEAMRSKLLTELLSVTRETASSATVATRYEQAERLLLPSNNKTSALVLDALLREKPEHPVIAKLARGVLDGRRHGRWGSTQENLVALQALRRYFETFEKATPNFSGKLWFGTAAYAEQGFVGHTNSIGRAQLSWQSLVPGSTHELAVSKQGVGRMYYRVGITYAPKEEHLPALDAGFIVRRQYEALEDPNDVTALPNGQWKVRLGAKVLVKLEVLNTTRRYSVALVDPLPAGFEIVNEHLATSERAAPTRDYSPWDYENMRDNRCEAFAMSLTEGEHTFAYTARATTPGTYTAAPAKAEEMYSPETFGRSTGEVVVVE